MSDTITTITTWAEMALQLAGAVTPLIQAGEAGLSVLQQTAQVITQGQASGSDPTAEQVAQQSQAIATALATLDAADASLA